MDSGQVAHGPWGRVAHGPWGRVSNSWSKGGRGMSRFGSGGGWGFFSSSSWSRGRVRQLMVRAAGHEGPCKVDTCEKFTFPRTPYVVCNKF